MAIGRTEAYDGSTAAPPQARSALRARPGLEALVVLTALLLVAPAAFVIWRIAAAVHWIVDGGAGSPAPVLVLLALAAAVVVRLNASRIWAATACPPEEARRIRATGSAIAWRAHDPAMELDSIVGAVDHRHEDAAAVLPELVELVRRIAAEIDVDAPHVELARAGWGVWLSRDGRALTIPTATLLVVSVDELAADIAVQLAPLRHRAAVRQLARARWISTAANPGGPVFGGIWELPWRPAMALGARLEAAGQALAKAVTDDAIATARGRFGVAADRAAAQRAVAPQLWREHLGGAQRAWTTTGAPLVPHAEWSGAWDAAVGREIVASRGDVPAPTLRLGWPVDASAAVVPVRGWPCALETLAGERGPQLLQRFDDGLQAQFRDRGMVEAFAMIESPPVEAPALGAEEALAPLGQVVGSAASEPLALPQGSPLTRLWPELQLLDHARLRRDAGALALARALDHADALPMVRANAAAVRWLSGDPAGLAAIDACLREAPRSVVALEPMVPPLRAAGAGELAARIDGAFAAFLAAPSGGELNLTKMWGRGRALEVVGWPPAVRDAITECLAGEAGLTGAWLVVARDDDVSTPFDPPVLALRTALLTMERFTHERADALRDAVALILPGTVICSWSEIEARRRTRLRRHQSAARLVG